MCLWALCEEQWLTCTLYVVGIVCRTVVIMHAVCCGHCVKDSG